MISHLTISTFIHVLSRSELLDRHQMDALADWLSEEISASDSQRDDHALLTTGPVVRESTVTSSEVSDWLIAKGWITSWQAEKLLQGKHRGFSLGAYVLQDKIARGGMSTIYAGRHRVSGEMHALKVLPLSKTHKASYLPRFKREADLAGRLIHPNIVRVFQIHEESDGKNDVYFMAMELLPGRDLYDLVNEQGPLPCRLAARYIQQAACGLQFAHDAGLVHRDVKPGNLFLHDDGSVRLLDLGLANDFESDESLTREYNERVLGTADYLSPEQAIDSHLADARSDIYSLGCTFYFLLTGRPPFHEGSLTQRILAHQSRTPDPISSFRDDVPRQLMDLLTDMMQKDCRQRAQSASSVADRLNAWLLSVEDDRRYDISPHLLRPIEKRASTDDVGHAMELGTSTTCQSPPLPPSQGSNVSNPRRQTDSPTDAIRSYKPLTTPPETKESAVAKSPFLPEFQQFLTFLNRQMGVDTVLTDEAQRSHLAQISGTIPTPPPSTEFEHHHAPEDSDNTVTADQHSNNYEPDETTNTGLSDELRAQVLASIQKELESSTLLNESSQRHNGWLGVLLGLIVILLVTVIGSVVVWMLIPEVRDAILRWTYDLNWR